MGIFAEYQPRYASHNIPTFPLSFADGEKKPAVTNFARFGLKASAQLPLKFGEADAFAFMAGKRSGVTVIDIDSPDDEDLLREVLARYGDTPMITRTGSGGFHLYYRHAGEERKIRFDPQVPVDQLGGGVVAAPPSKGSKGTYQLIRGTLADLDRLPFINQPKAANCDRAVRQLVQAGGRNKALLSYLRGEARHVDDLQTLIDVAQTYADQHLDRTSDHPFTDDEVRNVAKCVFDWTQRKIGEGQYFVGTGRYVIEGHDRLKQAMALGPYAFTLFMHLKVRCGGLASFQIANDMRHDMPDGAWPRRKMQDARQSLIDAGIIKEKHRPSSFYGPSVYQWA